jgi:G3E family GTPase
MHVQAVHELYDIVEGSAWPPGQERLTRIVVIGRNLSHSLLIQSLEDACAF